jgi:hypothetical protein
VDLRIDFVTISTTKKMDVTQKCDFILSKLQNERVVVFEGGLQPEEEAELIQEAMKHIDHEDFMGYRILSPAPVRTSGLFSRKDIRMTVIAPSNYHRLSVALV